MLKNVSLSIDVSFSSQYSCNGGDDGGDNTGWNSLDIYLDRQRENSQIKFLMILTKSAGVSENKNWLK